MDQERLAMLALHFIPGVGDVLFKQLLHYCGTATEVFKNSKGRLLKIPGVGQVTADEIMTKSTFAEAEQEFRLAQKEQATLIFYSDPQYPNRLKSIEDAPALIYLKGNINMNTPKIVGIVGTRQATDYGKEMVEKLVEGLVPHRALVLSGLAYGIDIHAHRQALRYGLPTIGVLGSGVDVIYPAAHKETSRKMQETGGVISENHMGTQPDAHFFPARNRIIAGLCDALIIIEAASRGGALITAEIANTYNKDVFAVPGNVGQPFSEGCNKLIKINKAHLLVSVHDLEYIMNWGEHEAKKVVPLPLFDVTGLRPEEQTVLHLLREKNGPCFVDELCFRSQIVPGKLAAVLLDLEFAGRIVSLPGKQYRLA